MVSRVTNSVLISWIRNLGGIRRTDLRWLIVLAAGSLGVSHTGVAEAAWSVPSDIGSWESDALEVSPILTFPTREDLYPRLAVSRSGLALVGWEGPNGEILVARKPAGAAPWIAPVVLSPCGHNPAVAADARGDALIAWGGCGNTIGHQSAFLPAGDSQWERPVEMPTPSTAAELELAFDSHGDVFAVWADLSHGEGEGGGNVEVTERASRTGTWAVPVKLLEGRPRGPSGANGEERGERPQIAAGGDQHAIVVWEQSSPGSPRVVEGAVLRQRYRRWSTPVRVSRAAEFAIRPQISLDGRGDAVVAWEAIATSATRAESAKLPAARNRWTPVATISRAIQIDTLTFGMDPRGEALALWDVKQQAPEHEALVDGSARTLPSGRWHAFGPIGLGHEPSVSLGEAGRAVVVWGAGYYQGLQFVEADVRLTDHRWLAPVRISSPARHSAVPHVALDAAGDAVAVWFDRSGLVEAATNRRP